MTRLRVNGCWSSPAPHGCGSRTRPMPVLWVPAIGSISPRTVATESTGPTLPCRPSGSQYTTARHGHYRRIAKDRSDDPAGSANPNFDHFLTEPAEKIRYSLSVRSCNLSISVDGRVVP